jgi:hypothetical protein
MAHYGLADEAQLVEQLEQEVNGLKEAADGEST